MFEAPSKDLVKITELTDAELEAVAGGFLPLLAAAVGIGVGVVTIGVGLITIGEKAYETGHYVGSKIP